MSEADVSNSRGKDAKYDATRAARRYVPLETVNAFVLSKNFIVAHGIVSNISETGACLITNTLIEPGQTDVDVVITAPLYRVPVGTLELHEEDIVVRTKDVL